jgi:histidyl-tRNA synthetase
MERVKGFNDCTGEEAVKKQIIKEILVDIFERYGFEPAETPIIEQESFVKGENLGDEAVSDIFKLRDKGGRKLALRYEFTFQLKRIAKNKKLPYRRYEIGPVFRDEPVSRNRFRQFTQADVDIVGSTIKDEAEVLALTYEVMRKLGIDNVIEVNNRKLLNEVFEEQGIKKEDREQVMREIDKLDKVGERNVKKNLRKYKAEKILGILKKKESYFKKYKAYKEIEELRKYCNLYDVRFNFKPGLVRGLSYYRGNVFETKAIAGGTYFVNNIQATGMSFGLERLSQLANIEIGDTGVLVLSIGEDERAIKLAQKLRRENVACQIMYGKPTKALDYANSKKIPFVLFVGKEELEQGKVKLRDMGTGKEFLISEKELIKRLG